MYLSEIGSQQPHPTVDIEAHTTGTNDTLGVSHVEGSHVANSETITRVTVWEGHRSVDVVKRQITSVDYIKVV